MKRLIAACVLSLMAGTGCAPKIPAFPGAEGFGACTPGGRGGKVLFVTNLKDYDPRKNEAPIPGSLRAAVSATGPRIVIFRISGTIELGTRLDIREPYLTVAGQTAPGDGICVKDHMTLIRTHDVIIRHMRFRTGDRAGVAYDGVWLAGAQNVILDHCSVSWGIDEVLSVTRDSKNVTVQWCAITEALHESHHKKGRHGYGSIIAGYDGGISFHHNLYAHNSSRNPRPGGYPDKPGPLVDFRNNVIYNWGFAAGYNGKNRCRINYVGNYLKRGPSTTRKDYAFTIGGPTTRFYAAGNVMLGNDAGNKDNWKMVWADKTYRATNKVDRPFATPPMMTQTAEQAFQAVLTGVGATLPERDTVDRRMIDSIRKGTGKLIDSQKQVGGWPDLKTAPPPKDSDGDGMPDAWETAHGLDPGTPADGNRDADRDGYTNIEEWINSTNPNKRESTAMEKVNRLIVAADGSGDVKTVQAAVDAVPDGADVWTEIFIKNGTYEGLVNIPAEKGKIILRGEDRDRTILQSSSFTKQHRKGKEYNKGDVTVHSFANDIILANLTVRNYTWKAHPDARAAWDIAVQNRGDRFLCYNVTMYGRHNTFDTRAKSGSRFYVGNCHVEGQSHFLAIFDNDGVFENTVLSYANVTGHGYASGIFKRGGAAEKLEDRTALVIKDCTLTVPKTDRDKLTACANNWSGKAVVYYINNTFEKGCHWKPFAALTRPTTNGTAWIFRYGNKNLPPMGDTDLKNPDGGPMIQELTKAQAEAITAEKLLAGRDGWNPRAVLAERLGDRR